MTEASTLPTNAGVAAALARLALDPAQRVIDVHGVPHLFHVTADGKEQLVEIPVGGVNVRRPGRAVAYVTLETADSLADYVNAFKGDGTRLFGAISENSITAVLDYHEPVSSPGGEPDHAQHVAALKLPFSLEWKAWTEADGKLYPQLDFVRFLEENREDIASPAAADVLEACRDLQALRKVDFRSVVREDSENYKIEWADESDARSKKGDVTLPAEFKLSIPVYFEGRPVEVIALLRWKLDTDTGTLALGIKLKRAERIRQAMFKEVLAGVVEATDCEFVHGRLDRMASVEVSSRH